MARDLSHAVRIAILTAMKGEPSITALVPAPSIYPAQPPSVPVWPFLLYGAPIVTPVRAAGYDGSAIVVAVHAYAKGPGDETTSAITAAVAAFLDGPSSPDDHAPQGLSLDMASGIYATVQVQSAQTFQDGSDANSWHGVVSCRVTVSA